MFCAMIAKWASKRIAHGPVVFGYFAWKINGMVDYYVVRGLFVRNDHTLNIVLSVTYYLEYYIGCSYMFSNNNVNFNLVKMLIFYNV
jgi:hypothetical protein